MARASMRAVLRNALPLPVHGERVGVRGFKRSQYVFEHRFGSQQYVIVPEADDDHAHRLEILRTAAIVWRSAVLSAVDLDRHATFQTEEINDVPADRTLPPEFVTTQATMSHVLPEQALCVRLVMA